MQKKVRELLDQRARAIEQARKLHETAEAENRTLTEEERTKFSAWMAEASKLHERAEDIQTLAEVESSDIEEHRRTDPGQPTGDLENRAEPSEGNDGESREQRDLREEGELRAFDAWLSRRPLEGRQNDVLQGLAQPTEGRSMSAGLDVSGGSYLYAPAKWRRNFIKALDTEVWIRKYAHVETVQGADSLGQPTIETDPADPDWTHEHSAGSDEGDIEFGGRELKPHLLARTAKISDTLLRRAPQASKVTLDRLKYRFTSVQQISSLYGNGNGQYLGIFYASDQGISEARDITKNSTPAGPTLDSVYSAKYMLNSGYWNLPQTFWIYHPEVIEELITMKNLHDGYIWQPSAQAGQPDRLLNIKVKMTEDAPSALAAGFYYGALAYLKLYHIVDSMAIRIQRLNELYSEQNKVGFKLQTETDGMPILEDGFVRMKLPV